jgi:hypothetical protein
MEPKEKIGRTNKNALEIQPNFPFHFVRKVKR